MGKTFMLQRLSAWEEAILGLLVAAVVGFGVLVELRSAFLKRRMGDAGCFLRAGWSMKAGGWQLYAVTCDNSWHYNYPPTLAVLMMPLADPPQRNRALAVASSVALAAMPESGPWAGSVTLASGILLFDPAVPGGLPFAWSVAIFYAANVLILLLAVHLLAGALEEITVPAEMRRLGPRCRRWWWLRLLPILACLSPIGHTLMRGQTNLLLLLLLSGMLAALLRQRNWQAGLWLAGAICLKIFPAFLLLVPLLRKDWRCLGGCTVGLAAGLILLPGVVLGAKQTAACYRELGDVLIRPALNLGHDTSRAHELTGVTATDNQAFRAIIHNWQYPSQATRSRVAAEWVSKVHWLVGFVLTALTIFAAWRWRQDSSPMLAVWVGALFIVMAPLCPVCHSHYFVLCVPLLLTLLALAWGQPGPTRFGWPLATLIILQLAGQALPRFPGMYLVNDLGLPLATALSLWLIGCSILWWSRRAKTTIPQEHRFAAAA